MLCGYKSRQCKPSSDQPIQGLPITPLLIMLFKGTNKFGSLDWTKEKPELDKINALYEEYNHTTDVDKRKTIYHHIDSVSGVAAKFAIANEYDKMMSSMGAQGTNAFTSFEQTVYTDDVPASAIDKYLTVQGDRFRNPQMPGSFIPNWKLCMKKRTGV